MKMDFILLKDQKLISDSEYRRAVEIWEKSKYFYKEKEKYVLKNNLDKRIFLYSGQMWNSVKKRLSVLFDKQISRKRIDQLRFCCSFSGHSIKCAKKSKGAKVVPDLVDSNDAIEQFDKEYPSIFIKNKIPIYNYREEIFNEYISYGREFFPIRMGEIGINHKGLVANYDTLSITRLLNILFLSGALDKLLSKRKVRILEIGGGYGALAYLLSNLFEDVEYTMVDLPECLLIPMIYLSLNCCKKIDFVPNYMFEHYLSNGRKFDAVVNTLSLPEMPMKIAYYYIDNIKKIIGDEGIFIECNYKFGGEGLIDILLEKKLKETFPFNSQFDTLHCRGRLDIWSNNKNNIKDINTDIKYYDF